MQFFPNVSIGAAHNGAHWMGCKASMRGQQCKSDNMV